MVDKKFVERITADYNDIKDYDGKFPDYKHADEGDDLKAVTSCMPGWDGGRLRQKSCCGPCCLQVFYTGAKRAVVDGRIELQPVVPLVVGLSMDDPVWDASTFSKNRDRLLKKKVAKRFFQEVLKQARERNLLSDEHFTVGR